MNIKTNELPGNSKIWIYQADRKLAPDEYDIILKKTKEFVRDWAAHGNTLKAKVDILFDVFLILTVDESEFSASGCSIDKSLHFIQQLKTDHGIDFLNRNIVALYSDNQVILEHSDNVKFQIKRGKIGKDSIIFNNLVNSKQEMESNWKVPVHRSWLKKYLPDN
jgi:hypothetical protein